MDYQGSTVREFLQTNGRVVLERVHNNYGLKSFTQKDIEDITNGYCSVLGEGGFGKVYKGRLLDNQRAVAVKRYKNGTKKEEFAKELIVHSEINHKNVVRLLGCCTEENALAIVMEFICNGNLENILHCCNANGHAPFPLDRRLDIAIESAEALSYMHSMYSPVLHGDIKPANILLDGNLRPKISDFGIARLLSADEAQHTRNVIGSIGYMDPLFCQSGILTPKSDVYSFGVVLLEMITRKKAAGGKDTNLTQSFNEALRKGKKVRQMFDVEIASEKGNIKFLDSIAKLAAECLKMEDKIRPEMVEVADRLRTIRKVLYQRKGRSSIDDRMEITTNFSNDPLMVPTISLAKLKQITRNFRNDTVIGGGLYGNVFFGVLKDGQKSAIMKLDSNSIEETFLEFPVVSRFKHENVIQLLGYCSDRENCVLAYEYAPRGSLHDMLHGRKRAVWGVLSWAQRVKIALSAANGLEFLHQKARPCVIHGAIKSSNILLFDDDVAKIGDIGVSRQAPCWKDNILLDRLAPIYHWEAPEELKTQEKTTKSDVYSFGVVLLELITGRNACAYDPTLPLGQNLVSWARPKLLKSGVHRCVDSRLGGGRYPRKALAKLEEMVQVTDIYKRPENWCKTRDPHDDMWVTQMAAIAYECVHNAPQRRPNMSEVVEALRPLLLSSSSNLPSAAEAS